MSWLWDSIAGCPAPHLNLITALLIGLGRIVESVLAAMVLIVLQLLRWSVLNTGGTKTVATAIDIVYNTFAGLGLGVAAVGLVWNVLRQAEGHVTGNRYDQMRSLVGRSGAAVVWVAGGLFGIHLLLQVNDAVVNGLNVMMAANAWHVQGCQAPLPGLLSSLGVDTTMTATTVVLWYFISDVLILLVVVAVVYAIFQFFYRLFEILFWGAVFPIAAGASVADPQRRAFTYVWGQLQGAVFTQAAIAVGIYIIEKVVLATTGGSGFFAAANQTGGHNALLAFFIGVTGFFFVGRIPKYFQELQGHSSSGGTEAGQLAAGYVMGRVGAQVLGATRLGVLSSQLIAGRTAGAQVSLSDPQYAAGTADGWAARGQHPLHSITSGIYQRNLAREGYGAAVRADRAARLDNMSGATARQVEAEAVRARGRMDAYDPAPIRTPTPETAPEDGDPGSVAASPGDRRDTAPPRRGRTRRPAQTPPPVAADGTPLGYDALALADIHREQEWRRLGRPLAAERQVERSVAVGYDAPAQNADTDWIPPAAPLVATDIEREASVGTAGGTSAAAFATRMAPLASAYLRGTVSQMIIDRHGGHPEKAQRELARIQQFDAQLAAAPTATLATLFHITPDDLNQAPVQQAVTQQLEEALRSLPRSLDPLDSVLRRDVRNLPNPNATP